MKKKFIKYLRGKHSLDWQPRQGELILSKSILENMDKFGRAPIDKVDKCFYEFYKQLNGASGSVDISWTELSFIKSEAYRAINQAGFVGTDISYAGFILSKKLLKKFSHKYRKQLIDIIDRKLQLYTEASKELSLVSNKQAVNIVDNIAELYLAVENWEQKQRQLLSTIDSITAQAFCAKLQRVQVWKGIIATLRSDVVDVVLPDVGEPIPILPARPVENDEIKLVSASICGNLLAADSWRSVLLIVCEFALLHKPYQVAGFDRSEVLNSLRRVFSYIESEIERQPVKLANGIYVETGNSGRETIVICKQIMEICGYSDTDLVIEYQHVGGDRGWIID